MADAKHITLTANTVATVTLDSDYQFAEIVNVTGSAAVYFTLDGTTPTVKGDDTLVLPAAISGIEVQPPNSAPTTVKLISTGTPDISVRGW